MKSKADFEREVTLFDILDTILDKGIVIQGDLVVSLAEVDLIYVNVSVLITNVENMQKHRASIGHQLQLPKSKITE